MKNKDEILEHLQYAMKHLDGLCWLLSDPSRFGELQVSVNGQAILKRPTLGQVRITVEV